MFSQIGDGAEEETCVREGEKRGLLQLPCSPGSLAYITSYNNSNSCTPENVQQ